MTWQTRSTSSAETENLGQKIGQALKGGEVIELVSDLGGGKTTLARGIARGAGSSSHVASPTFTLMREYQAGHFTIRHFDFYRLEEAGLMEQELQEYLGDKKTVVVIEWGKVVSHVLPKERLSIEIASGGETERNITLRAPKQLAYIFEGLK